MGVVSCPRAASERAFQPVVGCREKVGAYGVEPSLRKTEGESERTDRATKRRALRRASFAPFSNAQSEAEAGQQQKLVYRRLNQQRPLSPRL